MTKEKSGKSDSKSRTDDLIDEALKNLNVSVNQIRDDELGEVKEASGFEENTDSKKVARIDPKQYVEKEAYMRLAADFDNFRKRALKERHEWERQGKEKILRGFLDVLDNLARASQQADGAKSPLADGIRMVLSQAENWLSSEGLERIKSMGEVFDPAIHEAIARVADPSEADGTIIEETRRGYRWPDRLLRPASVVVSKSGETGEVPKPENS
jgi:molecular chaperone GrpE